jgi:hypothetical protein
MKKILVLFAVITIGIFNVHAQDNSTYNSSEYTNAIGLKFWPTGITIKHFLTGNKKALEFIGYLYNKGTRITGLYEIHGDINGVEGLRWYFGPGAHIAFYNNKNAEKYGGNASIGIDGVIGLDYKINNAPINLSLDYQPSIQLTNADGNAFTGWGGIAIRYTF